MEPVDRAWESRYEGPMFDVSKDDTFRKHLQEGEYFVWRCRPDQRVIFNKADRWLVPLTLVLGSVGVVGGFTVLANASNRSPLAIALAVAAIALSLYATVGRFFYKNWKKKHTWYVVTNRRIMFLESSSGDQIKSIDINAIPKIDKFIHHGYFGSVDLANLGKQKSYFANSGLEFLASSSWRKSANVLHDIVEPAKTFQIIDELKTKQ